jgi:hypothetical protein
MSDPNIETIRTQGAAPVGPLPLWFGILGGAVAWAAQLAFGDMFSELGCEAGGFGGLSLVLLLISLAAAIVAAWALLVAWRAHATLRSSEREDIPFERASFMAVAGILSSSLFLLVIVMGGFVPHLFLETCGA